jgi:hypothetical protein
MFLVNHVGVIAVVVYTSVAAWQASLTSAQLTVMQGQLNEMKSGSLQTSQLIGANVNLATAARRSADIAEVEARAWLAPISFAFANLNDVKEPLKVRVAYQNVGREPAKNVKNATASSFIRNVTVPPDQWGFLTNWRDEIFKPESSCNVITMNTSVVYTRPKMQALGLR